MSRHDLARALVPTLIAALAAASCSVSGDAAPGSSTTSAVDSTTTEAPGSSTTTTEPEVESGDADEILHDAVDITLDLDRFAATSAADLRAEDDQVLLELDGSADYADMIADVDISVSAPTGDQRIRLLADGESMWIAPEMPDVTVPGGRTWLRGSAELLVDGDGYAPEGLLGTIIMLRASDGATVEDEGVEIDGVATTEYAVTMTYDDAVDAAGDDVAAFQNALNLTFPQPVDLDVRAWVDEDGVLRRMQVEIDPDDDTPLGGTYDLDLEPLDEVEAPEPPDDADVATGPEALELLETLTGN